MTNAAERTVILGLIDKGAKSRNDWPGAPIGQIPIVWQATLHAMLTAGEVSIVERPAKVDPNRRAAFVVRTSTASS